MTKTHLSFFLVCAICLISAISATTYRIVIKDDSRWVTVRDSDNCKVDQEFTEVYLLPLQKLAYFSASDGFDASQCKTDLLATTVEKVKITAAASSVDEAVEACATACGATTCLCEGNQTCKPSIESCIEYFECDATSTTCTSIQGHYGRFDVDITGSDDINANLISLNKARDFVVTKGKSLFCWDEITYIYSIPSNTRNTSLQLFMLDNDKDKAGCTIDFEIPAEQWPQDIDSPSVSYYETYDVSLGSCIDYTTDKIICGSKCHAGCGQNALCVEDSDCVFGSCDTVADIDGQSSSEQHCSSAAHVSVAVAIAAAFLALLF